MQQVYPRLTSDSLGRTPCTWQHREVSRRHCALQVQCAASSANAKNASEQQSIPDSKYFAWAAQQGIQAPKLQLATFTGGLRGVKATQPIAQEEVLVSVPRNMALVVTPQMACPCTDVVSPAYWSKAPWFVKMALLVLVERRKGSASPVTGYIQHLPAALDLPMAWSDADLAQLQYPPLVDLVAQQKRNWQRFHKELTTGLQPGQTIDLDEFVWALQAVRSRCFSGPYSGAPLGTKLKIGVPTAIAAVAYVVTQHIPLEQALNGAIAVVLFNLLYDVFLSQRLKWYAMCPVIDSMNHACTSQNTVSYEYFRDAFAVAAEAAVGQGEQVFITYGAQSNDSLLQYYGFVEANTPHDTYTLTNLIDKLGVDAARVAQWRAGNAAQAGLLESTVVVKTGVDAPTLQAVCSVLGNVSEADGRRAVAGALAAELAGLPTTPAQDEQLLEDGRRMQDDRLRNAVLFRIQKKAVLEAAQQCLV